MGSEYSPAPLEIGTTEATFRDEGNTELDTHMLNNLERMGESSGEHIFKTITGIPSGLVALEASKVGMMRATFMGVMRGSGTSMSVREGKAGRECPSSLSVELRAKFLAKRFALSSGDVRTSGPWKRGGMEY